MLALAAGLIIAVLDMSRDPGQRNLKGEITAEGHGFRPRLRCI